MGAALALSLYVLLLAAAAVLVWRRPVVALYAFVVGLALHNSVMAALHAAGVRGGALTAIQAWKEILLGVAAATIARRAWRGRRLPFEPGLVDGLALAFAAIVAVYIFIPQDVLGGEADRSAVLYGARHALLPVAAYFVGRCLTLGAVELRRLGWTILGSAAAVAAIGLVEEYTLSVEWWHDSGVPAYFRDQLGFDYHGPGGMPENFAFNSTEGVFRRLISVFISPLASGFMFIVALLLAAAGGPFRRRLTLPLVLLCAVGLLFTLSRSSVLALAGGLIVVSLAARRAWPLLAAAATVAVGVAFATSFTSIAPETHFLAEDLAYQREQAERLGPLPEGEGVLDPTEPSLRSHLSSLRADVETVIRHPQGYGLGNAGAIARRNDVDLKAGESNYTEFGVEIGLAGALLFMAWSVALVLALMRTARAAAAPSVDWAATGLAGALAAVLVLGIQTDAVGVPWLAYCVWSLSGGLLTAAARRPVRVGETAAWAPETTPLSDADDGVRAPERPSRRRRSRAAPPEAPPASR